MKNVMIGIASAATLRNVLSRFPQIIPMIRGISVAINDSIGMEAIPAVPIAIIVKNGPSFSDKIEIAPASVSSPYYNTSKLCGTKHYAAAIIADPTEDVGEIFSLTFNNTILSCAKSDISICLPYTGSECETTMQNIIKQVKTNTTIKTTVMANAPEKATVAEGIVRYNFKITNKNSITSESDFRDAIQFNPISGSSVAMETYALGDVDHNGVIDAQDQTYLSQFLVGKIDGFNFTYSDGSNHYSFATNGLAADTNQDDVVDMLDAIQLNKYIAGQSNTLVD